MWPGGIEAFGLSPLQLPCYVMLFEVHITTVQQKLYSRRPNKININYQSAIKVHKKLFVCVTCEWNYWKHSNIVTDHTLICS